MNDASSPPSELVLGTRLNASVPEADQKRQRAEVEEVLRRLRNQPGVILADEVGMGKTFVALAIAYCVAVSRPRGPVIVMVPANLVDKWEQDLTTFCELYLENRRPIRGDGATRKEFRDPTTVRYGVARHSVELMKLLDDAPRERCHMIFLAQGAMSRRQSDKWVRLALIAEALRRHGRGNASRLIQVKKQIPRFLGKLLWAGGIERAHEWGEELWQRLLKTDPGIWMEIYNNNVRDESRQLADDPVPKPVIRSLRRMDLKVLAEALKQMPVRERGGEYRLSERLDVARRALRQVEEDLWKNLLAEARWRSPLLIVDEAHHLKNPGTSLARQFQSPDSERDLRTGDGAMAKAFDRMLFLTATPFQLGHHELIRVLERFGDVHWDESELGIQDSFRHCLSNLGTHLNESQRAAIALQRCWSRLRPEDYDGDINDVDAWWEQLLGLSNELLNSYQRAVVDAYATAKRCRDAAETALRPWIVRHNKGTYWVGTHIIRRQRLDGAAVAGNGSEAGLPIPPRQLLPFFLAARSAVKPGQDLLGEALCSSYEAFRFTRQNREASKDEQEDLVPLSEDLSHSRWYLAEFDKALNRTAGSTHPKMAATVRKVVDLWESGEKVLVFAFYRHTCRALRTHISQEIKRRVMAGAQQRLGEGARDGGDRGVEGLLERIQNRYFDDKDAPGRRAVDRALRQIIASHKTALDVISLSADQREQLVDVMRRFLRVETTLLRCFPIAEMKGMKPGEAVVKLLDHAEGLEASWRDKFECFIQFLIKCAPEERRLYLEAVGEIKTGGIRVEEDEDEANDVHRSKLKLANVQVATGTTKRETRARLMRAFNTPFFPDIFVCSSVMGEGVDLQRFCRHVIHHDLAWNPSSIEQRTGRIDRLGCKGEGRESIAVYIPYLAGTADERQYRVMKDREQWFRIVMGQDEVARLITPESRSVVRVPDAISSNLSFKLGLDGRPS